MCESARELFKKKGLAKMTNTRVLKYGKIIENIAYEIVEHTNSYLDNGEKSCTISFVTKKEQDYEYNTEQCFYGTFNEMLSFVSECKKEQKIITTKEYLKKMTEQKIKDFLYKEEFKMGELKNILLNLDIPYLKEVYVVVIDKELIMASLQYDYYGTNYEKEIKIKTIRKGEKCNGEYIE